MKLIRGLLLLVVIGLGAPLSAAAGDVPFARDLHADAAEAQKHQLPIMVVFSSRNCPYCELVINYYVKPMSRSAEYADRVIIRVVESDGARYLKDFDGEELSHESFADRYGVSFTPVVKFFDQAGRELAPEIAGFTSEDFYGFYLDEGIEQSLTELRSRLSRATGAPSV
jgi:thioredoxin-related protein